LCARCAGLKSAPPAERIRNGQGSGRVAAFPIRVRRRRRCRQTAAASEHYGQELEPLPARRVERRRLRITGTRQDRSMGAILPLPEFILFRTTGKEQSRRASAFQLSGSSAPSALIPESSFPDSEIRALTSALVSESTRPACGWRRMLEPSGVVSHLDPVGHPPDRPTGKKIDSPLPPRPAVAPAELKEQRLFAYSKAGSRSRSGGALGEQNERSPGALFFCAKMPAPALMGGAALACSCSEATRSPCAAFRIRAAGVNDVAERVPAL